MQHLDFIVTVDVLPNEMVGWSDVVLPECTYLEREDDLWAASYQEPFIALRQQVVPPLGESKPGWWIARELAHKLGLGAYFPWQTAREYLEKRASLGGYDYRELAATGVILGRRTATCEEEGLAPSFTTDSKKIELDSSAFGRAGLEPLPSFYPPDDPPPGMFRLLTGRAPLHTFSATSNNRLLAECYAENEVWVNATAARGLGGFDPAARERRPGHAGQSGRGALGTGQGQGDRAHPRRLRLPRPRLGAHGDGSCARRPGAAPRTARS